MPLERAVNKMSEVTPLQAKVYDSRDLERVLKLSRNSVGELLRSKRIRAIRYGRKWIIPQEAVTEFLTDKQD